ncbi:hypothetical protein [Prevotella sp. OH937_COT-195]|uniref:hypothetical protein n=1 Tax=Prevotella sp. OH937_COT-195 TaxID=2491051 RepID=UPI0018F475F8|nr:hypothetical protein [Prevotella sp. OH937_COT-195]
MPLPLRFPTAFARLLTSAQPLNLDAARYAFEETDAHLLNNRTKSVEASNDRFGFNDTHSRYQVATEHMSVKNMYGQYYAELFFRKGIKQKEGDCMKRTPLRK